MDLNPLRMIERKMTGKFVLVTGGTGYIGRHVVKALLEDVS